MVTCVCIREKSVNEEFLIYLQSDRSSYFHLKVICRIHFLAMQLPQQLDKIGKQTCWAFSLWVNSSPVSRMLPLTKRSMKLPGLTPFLISGTWVSFPSLTDCAPLVFDLANWPPFTRLWVDAFSLSEPPLIWIPGLLIPVVLFDSFLDASRCGSSYSTRGWSESSS